MMNQNGQGIEVEVLREGLVYSYEVSAMNLSLSGMTILQNMSSNDTLYNLMDFQSIVLMDFQSSVTYHIKQNDKRDIGWKGSGIITIELVDLVILCSCYSLLNLSSLDQEIPCLTWYFIRQCLACLICSYLFPSHQK